MLFDRSGFWAFGGLPLLAALLLLALLVRLDHLGPDLLTSSEAVIWRDWRKAFGQIGGPVRRELLPLLYFLSLRIWDVAADSSRALRLHSTLWSLALIALTFGIGAAYWRLRVAALAATLLAVSPLLVEVSQDMGPATEAAFFLLLNFAALLALLFRRSTGGLRWGAYLGSALLSILAHPLAIWVIGAQAAIAMVWGPRDRRPGFNVRLAVSVFALAVLTWIGSQLTRPDAAGWQPDWRAVRPGVIGFLHLLTVQVFWGTRVIRHGVVWAAVGFVAVVLPLLYGNLMIRSRPLQERAGLFLLAGVLPPIVIFLAPPVLFGVQRPPADVMALTLAPLALWAAASIRIGMERRPRQAMILVLCVGGLLFSLWSVRVDLAPGWGKYLQAINDQIAKGRLIFGSRIARLADFHHYLDTRIDVPEIESILGVDPAVPQGVVVLEPLSPLYLDPELPGSPGPFIRAWLEMNAQQETVLEDDYFRLALWKDFDLAALQRETNRLTFHDAAAWESLRLIRWFGPYDAGFRRSEGTTRVSLRGSGRVGLTLAKPQATWLFRPRVPPDYCHVYIPIQFEENDESGQQVLIWILPDGRRRPQVVTPQTRDFSFIWEPLARNEPLRIDVLAPGYRWKPDGATTPPLVIHGVGLRRHFAYGVDLGEPFDALALEDGWHEPQHDGAISYRWTEGRAELLLFLPAAGTIDLKGVLALRVAQRRPDRVPTVPFDVTWDGAQLTTGGLATRRWEYVRLPLPEIPGPGRHRVVIRSPTFHAPESDDPMSRQRLGIMVDRVSVE
jgi:hypothetical protein